MLNHILDNIQIGVIEFDSCFHCNYSNNYINMYIKLEYLAEQKYEEFYHYDDIETNKMLDTNLFRLHKDSETICRILVKDSGYQWYKVKRIYSKGVYLYTFEDINKIKTLEIKLREAKVRAEAAYNHKTLFLANMSHEIRTPLNGIIGMLTLLEDTTLNNDQKTYIEMLRECSVNLMTIINDILDYSKLEAGKISIDNNCFDLRTCVESTNDIILSKLFEKGLEYNYSISPCTSYFIKSDKNRIKQVLLNLLSNSIKFTERGSIKLDVSTDTKFIESDQQIFIKFSITDTGCGIDKSDKGKLFKSFSQLENHIANKVYEGTGLGLAISKELVTLMGGEIWVDWSEPGMGSRFCFTIKTKACNEESFENKDDSILQNKTVFILDDKLENRLGLAAIVQRWGMKVTTFNSGYEALYLLKSNDYDIGLVDICMPEMDGVSFSRKLNKQTINLNKTQIPLIALTSLGDCVTEEPHLFKFHLVKPVKETRLKQACIEIIKLSKNKLTSKPNDSVLPVLAHSVKNTVRILLVEDVVINQKVVVSFLNKMGFYDIDVCDNGKQCLDKMVTKTYDVILLDIRMPILNGETVLKFILKYYYENNCQSSEYVFCNTTKPYIIAITAYCLKEDREKYFKMGFDDYVPKPIRINDLYTVMNTCVEHLLRT